MQILNLINDFMWAYLLIGLLLVCSVYYTIRTKGVQFRMIPEMFRIMLGLDEKDDPAPEKASSKGAKRNLNSFHAFIMSLGSRVGTGNLAGVASAIVAGGPGAVFWMWIVALLGSCSTFVESTLGQLYKRKGKDSYYGGPAYYMERGLGKRWMGVMFSVLMIVAIGLANNMVQSITITDSLLSTFGWSKWVVSITLTIIVLVIILGGITRVAVVVSYIVPVMAIGYIALALVVCGMYADRLPDMFRAIIDGAFGLRQVGGGMLGAAVMQGVRRGLYSSESGIGSTPNIAAIAQTSHPVKQGLVQTLGVFIDTLVICTCTAVIVLVSGQVNNGEDGIVLALTSLETLIGPAAKYFLAVAMFLFAFSTILANCFYGENNVGFLTRNKYVIIVFRIFSAGSILYGAVGTISGAWAMIDLFIGLMAIMNLIAISFLCKYAFRLLDDYRKQKKAGIKDPKFNKAECLPEIADDLEAW